MNFQKACPSGNHMIDWGEEAPIHLESTKAVEDYLDNHNFDESERKAILYDFEVQGYIEI